jgi:glucose-6-phosphate isomerase
MRQVLADPDCPCSDPLYFMYRDLSLSEADAAWLREERLRYDMTVIPARVLCGEFVKTKGHFHPENPRGSRYPEIYEVLGGAACFLLQDRGPSDVVAITARAGEKVVVPPGYGHVTLNMARMTLTMVNMVSTAFESLYGHYEERQGAAYYAFAGRGFVPNPRYGQPPPLRVLRARDLTFLRGLPGGSLYRWVGNRDALGFLNHPEEYPGLLSLP